MPTFAFFIRYLKYQGVETYAGDWPGVLESVVNACDTSSDGLGDYSLRSIRQGGIGILGLGCGR